jgi:hypothetical protein
MLVPGSVLALWLGLRYTPVTAYVLFTVLAPMAVPRNVRRPVPVLLVAAALVQLVLAWGVAADQPGFTEWLVAVLG